MDVNSNGTKIRNPGVSRDGCTMIGGDPARLMHKVAEHANHAHLDHYVFRLSLRSSHK